MLDRLSDADPELRPKRIAQTSEAGESVRHLTYEDLEAYVAGRLAPARLQYCGAHLDSCDACRAELEDLRTFKSELSGFQRSEPLGRKSGRRKRRPGVALPLAAAAAAAIAVAAISVAFWWWREKPRTNKAPVALSVTHAPTPAPVAPSVTHAPTPAPVALSVTHAPTPAPVALSVTRAPTPAPVAAIQTPTRDSQLSDEIAALPADVRPAVSEVIQHGKLQLPADAGRLRESAPTFPDVAKGNTGFALLGPFGEAIAETRPEFRWQPLAGAIRYRVVIVDAGLHPVRRSPGLRTTSWRPRRSLRRGRTYLWQVTATLRGGSRVVASGPPGPEAVLRIIPRQLADEIAQFRQEHEDAHVVLGALYAQAGMLTASADELRKVPSGDSSYGIAQALLASLPSTSAF